MAFAPPGPAAAGFFVCDHPFAGAYQTELVSAQTREADLSRGLGGERIERLPLALPSGRLLAPPPLRASGGPGFRMVGPRPGAHGRGGEPTGELSRPGLPLGADASCAQAPFRTHS